MALLASGHCDRLGDVAGVLGLPVGGVHRLGIVPLGVVDNGGSVGAAVPAGGDETRHAHDEFVQMAELMLQESVDLTGVDGEHVDVGGNRCARTDRSYEASYGVVTE